jgi:hypothetical protein
MKTEKIKQQYQEAKRADFEVFTTEPYISMRQGNRVLLLDGEQALEMKGQIQQEWLEHPLPIQMIERAMLWEFFKLFGPE